MFKHTILLSSIMAITACSSLDQTIQCNSKDNFIHSNDVLITEYQKLDSEGKIKSIYYNNNTDEKCNYDSCLNFNYEKFDFVERNINNDQESGIYTIKPKNNYIAEYFPKIHI